VHRGWWWWTPGQSKSVLLYCHLHHGTLTGVGAYVVDIVTPAHEQAEEYLAVPLQAEA